MLGGASFMRRWQDRTYSEPTCTGLDAMVRPQVRPWACTISQAGGAKTLDTHLKIMSDLPCSSIDGFLCFLAPDGLGSGGLLLPLSQLGIHICLHIRGSWQPPTIIDW